MTFRPFTVARIGVYLALAAAVLSAWLGHRAGASLDWALMRSVFVFVIVVVLGFGAEAVLTVGFSPREAQPAAPARREESDD